MRGGGLLPPDLLSWLLGDTLAACVLPNFGLFIRGELIFWRSMLGLKKLPVSILPRFLVFEVGARNMFGMPSEFLLLLNPWGVPALIAKPTPLEIGPDEA